MKLTLYRLSVILKYGDSHGERIYEWEYTEVDMEREGKVKKSISKRNLIGAQSPVKKDSMFIKYIPVFIVLILIPLITVIHVYDSGLENYAWFSTADKIYDFFLYYKSGFIMLAGILTMLLFSYRLVSKRSPLWAVKSEWYVMVGAGLFAVFSLVSAIFAGHKNEAFFGGYEQFEGCLVLITYVILFLYVYGYVDTYKLIDTILSALMVGATILSTLGAFQAFGFDWIQSWWAKYILTPELAPVSDTFSIKLNFGEGTAYATLYNPNYVGTYVALVLPFSIFMFYAGKHFFIRTLSMLNIILQMIMLASSGSFTGFLGLIGALGIYLIIIISRSKTAIKVAVSFASVTLVTMVVLFIIRPLPVANILAKLGYYDEYYRVESITEDDTQIKIKTFSGKTICVRPDKDDLETFEVTDAEDNDINMIITTDKKAITDQEGYEEIAFQTVKKQISDTLASELGLTGSDNVISVLRVIDGSYTWDFTIKGDEIKIINNYDKSDDLIEIDKLGFHNHYKLASRRGYIWSRSVPLALRTMFVGVGADNFVYNFPNNDYVGKLYQRYQVQTVTKPHDMFLQIWIQDGLPALIGFMALFIIFMIKGFRLVMTHRIGDPDRSESSYLTGVIIACMCASSAYMISGIANDSTITVAPLYWVLLAVGYSAVRLKKP